MYFLERESLGSDWRYIVTAKQQPTAPPAAAKAEAKEEAAPKPPTVGPKREAKEKISSEKAEGHRDWNSSEYEDTINSGGKKEMKALIFHKMDTEEISDRYVALLRLL
ncbi:hypothetical protein Tco_0617703 [Tanacetum coccineum]